MPENESKELKFYKKLDNFWYHYKWQTLLGTFFGIMLIVAIVQFFSNTEPDANILYVGPNVLNSDRVSGLEHAVNEVSRDYNQDGEINVDFVQITIYNSKDIEGKDITYNPEEQSTAISRYQAEIIGGDTVIAVLDEVYYKELKDTGHIKKLSDIFEVVPDNAEDDSSFLLENLDAKKLYGFNGFPMKSRVCVLNPRGYGPSAMSEDDAQYQNNLSVFRDIINYKHSR